MKLKVLDLFSGIGGISLGLERTEGFETVAFCEMDVNCQAVLKKHWPEVPIFNDVSTLKGSDIGTVDVICGGFPCQDISLAGKGEGLAGARSGLWWEFHRLIKEIKPKWVIAENVSALRSRGLDEVLRSLSEIGYDAEWHCIPASAVGAPHRRDRVWIVAYPHHSGNRASNYGADDNWKTVKQEWKDQPFSRTGRCSKDVAYSPSLRPQGQGQLIEPEHSTQVVTREAVEPQHGSISSQWKVEPDVGRVADGIPNRAHRLKQLGNAVVPQIPELLGNAILSA